MAILKLLIAFVLMVMMLRLGLSIGLVLMSGAFLLGLIFGMPIPGLVVSIAKSAVEFTTLRLVALVVMAILLSEAMRQNDALRKIELAVKLIFKDLRLGIATIPALIGLIPMPSGALVSAPMIETLADELGLDATHRTLVNYWFRHIWEYSWPLYQSLIIAAALLNIRVNSLILRQFPLSLIAAGVGYVFALRPIAAGKNELKVDVWKGFFVLLKAIYPILIILVVSILLGVELLLGLAVALIAAVLPIFKSIDWRRFFGAVSPSTVLVVFAVMAFKAVLDASGAVNMLPVEISRLGLHPAVVVVMTPMIVGLLTGVSFSFVGITFSLLLPFFNSWTSIVLAYLSGFVGVLLSPVHLCLVLSAKYYKAPLGSVYRLLYAPVAVVMILGTFWALTI